MPGLVWACDQQLKQGSGGAGGGQSLPNNSLDVFLKKIVYLKVIQR